jgi:predicted nucleotidyltransferase
MADALFGRGRQRVLGVLFGNPGRCFFAREVIARAGVGSGAVQRELERLEKAGLVVVSRTGRQKHYRANPDSPVFAELRSLVLKTSGLADILRDALAAHGSTIDAAFVFGSVAKGEDVAASDVDVLVVSDEATYASIFRDLEPASRQLGRTVNPTLYSRDELARRRAADSAFVRRVLEGPRIWLMGDEDVVRAG